MKQKLQIIKNHGSLPKVTAGNAYGVKEFFDRVIKPQFSNKDTNKETHKALMDYVKLSDATFVLRLYANDSNNNYSNLRRGFLTQYCDGKKMVFCDNTFAMPFVAMKISGYSYTKDELYSYMTDPTTRFGFSSTKEERELSIYNWSGNRSAINLNSLGWYLAHIVPVGKYYYGEGLKQHFINPSRDEWTRTNDHIRRPESMLTNKEMKILKAHFLRFVHPLNSFVVPKRVYVTYGGTNIGEEHELINYVQEYLQNEFPKEYDELYKHILYEEHKDVDRPSKIGKITWNTSELTKKERLKANNSRKNKSSKKRKTLVEDRDKDGNNVEDKLKNILRSIGKSVFVKLYPLVMENFDITIADVCNYIHEYALYKSQEARLSRTRSIILQGLGRDALFNIVKSTHLSIDIKEEAKQLLSKYK